MLSTYRITQWRGSAMAGTLPSMALPEYDKSEVGKRIVLLRAALNGMEQAQLAAGLGITPQKLNNYEKGRDLIPVHVAAKLAQVTGAHFDYIYRGQMVHLPHELLTALLQADRPQTRAG